MISVIVSEIINAPCETAAALYGDFQNWDKIFPLIRGVRVVEQKGERVVLEIEHAEGRVPNVLRKVAPDTFELWENKKRYSGMFWNTFTSVPTGTKYTVRAEIHLKGFYRLLELFGGELVKRRIRQYVIEPLKAKAEKRQKSFAAR